MLFEPSAAHWSATAYRALHGPLWTTIGSIALGGLLVSSSSLAVGLALQIPSAFPACAATVTGIVLAAVARTLPTPLDRAVSVEPA